MPVAPRFAFSTLSSLSSALPLFSSSSRVSSALPCAAFSSLRSPASRLCGGASLPSFWRPSPPSGGVFSPAPSAQPRRPAIPSRETALWGFTIFVNPDTAPDNKDLIVGTYNRMCISQGHIRRIRENRRRVKRVTRGEGGSFAVLKRRKERYWEMRKTRETARRVLWTDIGKLRYGQLRRLIEALHTNVTLEERKLRQETGEQAPPSAREAAAPLSRTGSP
ncbi:hypothetical protein BESB_004650 [Besnoitia besnoiti]|uniref:Uncharacterized protein n=1 Tax=Besnoitia besnoiti TaxID=94643 RepID=A0A2A9MLI6_BESBE|nr:hypothetical protein BESB_004650 [Besnoitia besnoiti]PFH38124.1 hypothetical protein BESB_004650 [Besnoitia besnoiti]